ncbi:nucleoside deaminase [Loigolactobacillus jiayinensis]|uniref:Nucleoside deaminase n=1 Tax=Loigolactobacillus jiayinensis TaxID=2486016 RepID=A0ABW1REC9_9LACO|nr:nucleoside deaminase [Loigolactobacillus jiayinensis]
MIDHATDQKLLHRTIKISQAARDSGNTPFGALLADQNGEILMEQGNIELTEHICTGHAECTLAARASHKYSKADLWQYSLYTTAEPCVMCAGAIYWANIGRVVYAMEERRLLQLTGSNDVNPTFDLPTREIYRHGQKNITVVGPFKELEVQAAAVHQGYWD